MIHKSVAEEQETILRELRQVFDETTTEILGRLLGRMVAQIEEMRVMRDQSPDLQAALTKLAEAQAHTEAAVCQSTNQQ